MVLNTPSEFFCPGDSRQGQIRANVELKEARLNFDVFCSGTSKLNFSFIRQLINLRSQ